MQQVLTPPSWFLVPKYPGSSQILNFVPSDTEELFQQNLQKQPQDWFYRTNKVIYKYNSLGYRCPEFNNINWSESVVIKGCSFVEGIGLAEEDTLSSRLAELFGIPVINLGAGGSSVLFTLFNTYKLLQNSKHPKLVIEFYTGLDRNLMFNRQYIVPHALGPWSAENNGITDVFDASFVKEWVKHSTVSTSEQQKNIFFAKINEMLWRSSGIPLYETSFFIETAKSLQINFTNLPKNEFARDRSHPGRTIIKSIAKKIFDEVQSNNLI